MTYDRRRRLTTIAIVVAGIWLGAAPAAGQEPVPIALGARVAGKSPHDYLLAQRAPGQAVVCQLVSSGDANSFRLKALTGDGKDVVATDQAGPFQLLAVPASAGRVRVVHEGTYPDYTLTCESEAGARLEGLVASGVAVRASLPRDEYLRVYDFAQQDWSQPRDFKKDRPAADVRKTLAAFAGLSAFSNDEPVVLFVGIAGLAKILVVDPDSHAGNPDRDNLDPTRGIWVAYVEDDLTPYETSIDVQFNRANRVKFDQFEPGSAQLGAAASLRLIGNDARPIRVGLKRVPLKLPMAFQVAFTRQGGLYGFRQWQKSLRVRRGGADLSGVVFIPVTEVTLNTHALVPQDDYPLNGTADYNLIVQESRRRQVYAAVRLGWPGVRAHGQDAVTTLDRLKGIWVPDLMLGIGLPPTGAVAGYAGLSWPIPRLDWLHFTAGAAILWQSRLKDVASTYATPPVPPGTPEPGPIYVGSRVDLKWTQDDIVDGTTPVARFTFGLAVDLFTWP